MTPLEVMLIRHEQLRLKPYLDEGGKLTIGIGRCLDTLGITTSEALALLANDIQRVTQEASTFIWYTKLDPVRANAICDMLFNLGLTRFCEFKMMIGALENLDYEAAANAMLASTWAAQVKTRAVELATMMRTGEYPTGVVS